MQMLLDTKNPDEKIVLNHDVDVPMRDGAIIKANVFRPPEKFSGEQTVHSGPGRDSYLQLPVTNQATIADLLAMPGIEGIEMEIPRFREVGRTPDLQ